MAETERDDTSTGKDRWSTNPAASEMIPGFSKAVCIRLLIEGALVRCAALLRMILGVFKLLAWLDAAGPSESVATLAAKEIVSSSVRMQSSGGMGGKGGAEPGGVER